MLNDLAKINSSNQNKLTSLLTSDGIGCDSRKWLRIDRNMKLQPFKENLPLIIHILKMLFNQTLFYNKIYI